MTTPKPVVTREHRHLAMLIGCSEYDIEKMHPLVRRWLETGKAPNARQHFSASMLCITKQCEAEAIAAAEERGDERGRWEALSAVLALVVVKQRDYCERANEANELGMTAERDVLSAAANALSGACDAINTMRGDHVPESQARDSGEGE
jgi:hypothetical protein